MWDELETRVHVRKPSNEIKLRDWARSAAVCETCVRLLFSKKDFSFYVQTMSSFCLTAQKHFYTNKSIFSCISLKVSAAIYVTLCPH